MTHSVPFDDIATVVGRTPSAARMLASRARRRVDERTRVARPEPVRHRTAVEAFLAAARDGDFERLLTLLDPDVVDRAHRLVPGVPATARGPHDVTARALRFAPLGRWTCAGAVGDAPALFVLHEGRLLAALIFGFRDASIVGMDTITDRNELQGLDIATFDD